MESTTKITPFLWFDNNAEDAMNHYTTVFKDSKVVSTAYYGKGAPMPDGSLMTCTIMLNGQEFFLLNGGPAFQFNESVSFFVKCETQEEVNHYWEKLSEGGRKSQCGWLKDKFGLSWQIVPNVLGELLYHSDPQKSQRVMSAMMKMSKLDIATLQKAADGE